jgi:hypothetical protein
MQSSRRQRKARPAQKTATSVRQRWLAEAMKSNRQLRHCDAMLRRAMMR